MVGVLQHGPYYVAAAIVAAAAGVTFAWWLRRRTMISIRNLYLATGLALALDVVVTWAHATVLLLVLVPATSFTLAASALGRRWRLSDLGAGEELRTHEQGRRWIWQPALKRDAGESVRIATQGQIVRERAWPDSETYVPLTADLQGPRLPRRSGRHIFCAGATGSGKTTSALRAAAGRVLKDRAALFFVDQKGDPNVAVFLRELAAFAGVAFIDLDPRNPESDHWQPLWGDRPAEVVARVLAGIETNEPYYADTLRKHVGIVASVLHVGGYWPPSFPLLVEASQLSEFDRIIALAKRHKDEHPDLWRRVGHQARFVESKEGEKALGGGLVRLDLVIGEAWRNVFTPRQTPAQGDGAEQLVGVSLAEAIGQRAVVLWRTHVDQMPDEAKTVTAVILNDIHASAVEAQAGGPAPWTCVLDEFGAVIATASQQALALLQRGRTHEGQVLVITQSVADIEALTGTTGLLASMADNFAGFIVHRQSAPESRDWLAKLMGTTALWQSTDQTSAYAATGAGSRRRVREFRVSSDTFAELRVGEAVIHTTLGPPPAICRVLEAKLHSTRPLLRLGAGARSACEIEVHAAKELPPAPRTRTARKPRPATAPPPAQPPVT
ncbi:MAG: TraM recognition domain-containing protein, partial [Solirubrobacterales bacterium]|nr:TraM recognition domain-containing protein [Solirubrobacterales bacterium]